MMRFLSKSVGMLAPQQANRINTCTFLLDSVNFGQDKSEQKIENSTYFFCRYIVHLQIV